MPPPPMLSFFAPARPLDPRVLFLHGHDGRRVRAGGLSDSSLGGRVVCPWSPLTIGATLALRQGDKNVEQSNFKELNAAAV